MEDWEKEIDNYANEMLNTVEIKNIDLDKFEKTVTHLKNYFQKERVIAKIKENNQWIEFFQQSEEVTDVTKKSLLGYFSAINMKYESLLTRF